MFWLKGEGLGEEVNLDVLGRFLGIDARAAIDHLHRLIADGYLSERDGWYSLTEKGVTSGSQLFADEFAELTRPAHGECGPDCWCHASADEAAACHAERTAS